MIKILTTLFIIFFMNGYAEQAVCPKCEAIREENKKKTAKYDYYEDYVEAKKKGEETEIKLDSEKKSTKKELKR